MLRRALLHKARLTVSDHGMDAHTVTVPRVAWSLSEVEVATGLSRSLLYRLMAQGQLQTVKIRGRRLVLAADFERLCTVDEEKRAALV
jgi:hypothetical protein